MNGVIRNVSGMGKNFKVCRYTFLFIYLKVTNKKKCARSIYYTLLKIYRPQETMTLNLHLVKLQIFVCILSIPTASHISKTIFQDFEVIEKQVQ